LKELYRLERKPNADLDKTKMQGLKNVYFCALRYAHAFGRSVLLFSAA